MSFNATRWAWEVKLPYSQKYVLLALADMASDPPPWMCYPSLETLSKRTNLSRRTLIRLISNLKNRGLVRITKRYGISNNYELIAQNTSVLSVTGDSEGSAQSDTTPVSSLSLVTTMAVPSMSLPQCPNWHYTSVTNDTQTYKEPINNQSILINKEGETKKTNVQIEKPKDVSSEVFKEWVTYKKQVCGKCSRRMIDSMVREAHLADMTTEAAMIMQMEKGWRGFEASWVKRAEAATSKTQMSSIQPKEPENLPSVYFGKSGPL